MAHDADGAAVLAEGVEDVEDVVEGLGVEGAEALVDEEGGEVGPAVVMIVLFRRAGWLKRRWCCMRPYSSW